MTRVLRYPRMSMAACTVTIICALLRDYCVSASMYGYARVLLYATVTLLIACFTLLSCRFFVDAQGVGVGFLLSVRRTPWDKISSLGLLCCNSRRRYLYGMYRGETDFLNLLHRAPLCGSWGFVVPMEKKLLDAVCCFCPFEINLSPFPAQARKGHLRLQWHQAAFYTLVMLPSAALASATGALMAVQAAHLHSHAMSLFLTLTALALFAAALALLYRLINTLLTCPGFNEEGVCTGRALYLDWENVRFGYVHRIGRISGMFLLSQPYIDLQRRGAPPVVCMSMPDTSTLLLAYLTYCPYAEQGEP